MERPQQPIDYHEGMTWVAEPEDDDWRVVGGDTWKRCTQPRCGRPAVIQLRRVVAKRGYGGTTHRWWGCCDHPHHRYGRWVEGGRVMHWALREVQP